MRLLWKLLRRHVSMAQLLGFFLANWIGLTIILLSAQFYYDVRPLFGESDSFFKKQYLVISKPVNTLGSLLGSKGTFSSGDIQAIEDQPFTKSVGAFSSSLYDVSMSAGMFGTNMNIQTEMFFESVPDGYIDIDLSEWKYLPGSKIIPIILPKNYLNLYNFGFAQSRNLPRLSEGVLSMLSLKIYISGNGKRDVFEGRIVGLNDYYAAGRKKEPSRLIVEVTNPADEAIVKYMDAHRYEVEGDDLESGKTAWFLKIIVGIVFFVGFVITLLSFYILMLSIFLILQKNTGKIQNLMLIGYSPRKVALPYQLLVLFLNILVSILAVTVVWNVHLAYVEEIRQIYPSFGNGSLLPIFVILLILFVFISLFNIFVIHKKVKRIWNNSRKLATTQPRLWLQEI